MNTMEASVIARSVDRFSSVRWRSSVARLVLIFGTAVALQGADPIIGTWTLDLLKSKAPQNLANLKTQTEVYKEVSGGQIELTLTRTRTDGSSQVSVLSWPSGGGLAKRQAGESRTGASLVETLIAPGEWYVTSMQDGKQYLVMHKVVSENGRTMCQTVKGADAQGNPVEFVAVLHKQ